MSHYFLLQLTYRFNVHFKPFIKWINLTVGICLLPLFSSNAIQAAEFKPISQITVLGLDLIESDLNSVRSRLWDIGGFLQAKSTVKQHNIDKFFPWSTMRDSYHITFRYNHAGKITSVKRLYRPYSLEQNNQRTALKTRDVATQLIKQIGQPTSVESKGWGGSLSYRSYTWQDDKITIRVDREGSEKLGNIFIQYSVNIHDPYEVVQKNNIENEAGA